MLEKLKEFSGAFSFQLDARKDDRGVFTKTFNEDVFKSLGIQTHWAEQYVSTSQQGVLRGLHFQVPPCDHDKLVVCLSGRVFDVVLDIRKDSPTFGKAEHFILDTWQGIYIPQGFAHGFCVSEKEPATLSYNTSTVYSPENDKGIYWKSADVPWPLESPVVSPRDEKFEHLKDFVSPF